MNFDRKYSKFCFFSSSTLITIYGVRMKQKVKRYETNEIPATTIKSKYIEFKMFIQYGFSSVSIGYFENPFEIDLEFTQNVRYRRKMAFASLHKCKTC